MESDEREQNFGTQDTSQKQDQNLQEKLAQGNTEEGKGMKANEVLKPTKKFPFEFFYLL